MSVNIYQNHGMSHYFLAIYNKCHFVFYRNENPKFVDALRQLESSPVCQSLAMHSFLMLPMQRITRLPLLVDAIYNRLNTTSPEYQSCKEALQTLNKVIMVYHKNGN